MAENLSRRLTCCDGPEVDSPYSCMSSSLDPVFCHYLPEEPSEKVGLRDGAMDYTGNSVVTAYFVDSDIDCPDSRPCCRPAGTAVVVSDLKAANYATSASTG